MGDKLEFVLACKHRLTSALDRKPQAQRGEAANDCAALATDPDIHRDIHAVYTEHKGELNAFRALFIPGQRPQRPA